MAEFTPNYELKKPGADDFYDVKDFNDNMDKIDAELKKAQDHRENISNPHKVMANQVGAINPNLLINGDFQVWQRGTSFTGIGMLKYTADRWRLNASGSAETVIVSKADDGMYVSIGDAPNLVLCYTFEDSEWVKIEGKTVTLSYSIDNEVKTRTFTMEQDDSDPNSLAFFVDYGDKTEFTINWVKLELGSVATDFSPRPYAEELAMCQRYFQRKNSAKQPYNTIGQCFIYNNKCFALIHLPVKLRTVPTCTQKGVLCATADMEPEITIQSVNGISDDILKIYCSSEQSFTENCLFELRANNDVNGDIWIDAEIY
ncbi:MAG: hypothetical protein ACFWTN_07705 [Clostridium sp.]|jgi:hypothetical protein